MCHSNLQTCTGHIWWCLLTRCSTAFVPGIWHVMGEDDLGCVHVVLSTPLLCVCVCSASLALWLPAVQASGEFVRYC
jgi:hypothetical protein